MITHTRRVIIALVSLFLMYSLSRMLFDYQKKFAFYKQYKKDYEAEKERNKQLKSNMIKSQDYKAVERTMREKLNLGKPGEIVVLIPKITPTSTPTPTPIKPSSQQWLELFLP